MALSASIFKATAQFCSQIEAFMGKDWILSETSLELNTMREVFDTALQQSLQQAHSQEVFKKYQIAVACGALKAVQLKIADLMIEKKIFNYVPSSDRKKLAAAQEKLQEVATRGTLFENDLLNYPYEVRLDQLIVEIMCESLLEEVYRIDFQFEKRLSRHIDTDYSLECRVKDLEALSADYAVQCQKIYNDLTNAPI